jgi:hypothetical protein
MSYRYGTILEVQNDDPVNDLEAGDIIIEAGKLDDGDSYTVLSDDGHVQVEMETVEVYDAECKMSEREVTEFARDQYLEQEETKA